MEARVTDGPRHTIRDSTGPAGSLDATKFGVRGDNSTASAVSNTTKMQQAIDEAAAAGGGMIWLPRGTMYLAGRLTNKESVSWHGQGHGPTASMFKAVPNFNDHLIVNEVWDGTPGHAHNAQWGGLYCLRLHGDQVNQNGAGPYDCVHFTTNPLSTVGTSGDPFMDPAWTIRDVVCYKPKGSGIDTSGRSDGLVDRVKVQYATEYGIKVGFDTTVALSTVEKSGKAGFFTDKSSTRFVGNKAYLCGEGAASPSLGHGFHVGSGPTEGAFVGNDAQQVYGHGLYIDGANGFSIEGFTAQECGFNNGAGFAGVAVNGGGYHTIRGTNVATSAGNANALLLSGGPTNCDIALTHRTQSGGTAGPLGSPALITSGSVRINGNRYSVDPVDPYFRTFGMALAYAIDGTEVAGATGALTAGLMYGATFHVPYSAQQALVGVKMRVVGNGVGLTNGFVALYDAATNVPLAVTAQQATAWQTTGLKTMPWAVSPGNLAGRKIRVGWWHTGTTGPSMARGQSQTNDIENLDLVLAESRFWQADDGVTPNGLTTTPPNPMVIRSAWATVPMITLY